MKALALILFILIAGIIFYAQKNSSINQENKDGIAPSRVLTPIRKQVDFEASFAIYTHGTFRIFTDPRYHNLSAEVYIDPSKPNSIKVKRGDITWGDFFETLPMKLTKECLTTGTGQVFCTGSEGRLDFYINEVKDPHALDKKIREGDKLIVTYGS